MNEENFEMLGEAVDAAIGNYRNALERLVLKTLKDLSDAEPEVTFDYSAGMGRWGFNRKGMVFEEGEDEGYEREDALPDIDAADKISEAESAYGYGVVPELYAIAKGGKIERKY